MKNRYTQMSESILDEIHEFVVLVRKHRVCGCKVWNFRGMGALASEPADQKTLRVR